MKKSYNISIGYDRNYQSIVISDRGTMTLEQWYKLMEVEKRNIKIKKIMDMNGTRNK